MLIGIDKFSVLEEGIPTPQDLQTSSEEVDDGVNQEGLPLVRMEVSVTVDATKEVGQERTCS